MNGDVVLNGDEELLDRKNITRIGGREVGSIYAYHCANICIICVKRLCLVTYDICPSFHAYMWGECCARFQIDKQAFHDHKDKFEIDPQGYYKCKAPPFPRNLVQPKDVVLYNEQQDPY